MINIYSDRDNRKANATKMHLANTNHTFAHHIIESHDNKSPREIINEMFEIEIDEFPLVVLDDGTYFTGYNREELSKLKETN